MRFAIPLAVAVTVATASPACAEGLQDVDIGLLRAINGAHSPPADVVMGVFSNEVLLVGLAPVTSYAVTGNWGAPVRVVESELVGGALCVGLKAAFNRPRPYATYPDLRLPEGPEPLASFPSGHAAVAFSGAAALAIEQPAWAVPAYVWAGLVCYSRMYNGVHYPTDVLSGALLGVGTAYATHALLAGLNTQLGVPAAATGTVVPLQFSASF